MTFPRRYKSAVLATAACAAAVAVTCVLSAVAAPWLALSPARLASQPWAVVTYALVHGNAFHALVNMAVITAMACFISSRGRGRAVVPVVVAATILSGLVFCAVASVAGTPAVTLSGASAPAFALAAYACTISSSWRFGALVALLAVATLFGANAGGGAAHCSGMLVGVVAGRLSAVAEHRRSEACRRARAEVSRKIHTSGYGSLSDCERKLLSNNR